METILVVDDDRDAAQSLLRLLKGGLPNFQYVVAYHQDEAQIIRQKHSPLVSILDLNIDDTIGVESGFRLLRKFSADDPTSRIIVLTGHGQAEFGVRALSHGAASFVQKPAEPNHIIALVRDASETARLKRILVEDRRESIRAMLVGQSRHAEELIGFLEFAASTPQPVLITGETGTGKGLAASTLHRLGKRKNGRFVRYQPTFQSSDLVNSDLFGHVKGAFTGALHARKGLVAEANEGTLFLDEIDELPPAVQVSLLGLLQDKRFRPVGATKEEESDFRLVCASNRDVNEAVTSGKLRSDFFHRISHLKFHLAPLRERIEDIPALAAARLRTLNEAERIAVYEIEAEAVRLLQTFPWPGNIRQFEAVLDGAAYLAQFSDRHCIQVPDVRLPGSSLSPRTFQERVEAYKVQLIQEALGKHNGNQVKASEELLLDRSTLRRILARTGSAIETNK